MPPVTNWHSVIERLRTSRLFQFRADARHVLLHAWSARFSYFLVFINAADAGFYFLIGYAPVPAWALGLISALFGALIPYARVVVQRRITGDPENADQ